MSGDLLLMSALIGVSRAVFGSAKPTSRLTEPAASNQAQDARGRSAEAPSEIPAKGWMDIAWRVLAGFQSDRVMLSDTWSKTPSAWEGSGWLEVER